MAKQAPVWTEKWWNQPVENWKDVSVCSLVAVKPDNTKEPVDKRKFRVHSRIAQTTLTMGLLSFLGTADVRKDSLQIFPADHAFARVDNKNQTWREYEMPQFDRHANGNQMKHTIIEKNPYYPGPGQKEHRTVTNVASLHYGRPWNGYEGAIRLTGGPIGGAPRFLPGLQKGTTPATIVNVGSQRECITHFVGADPKRIKYIVINSRSPIPGENNGHTLTSSAATDNLRGRGQ